MEKYVLTFLKDLILKNNISKAFKIFHIFFKGHKTISKVYIIRLAYSGQLREVKMGKACGPVRPL